MKISYETLKERPPPYANENGVADGGRRTRPRGDAYLGEEPGYDIDEGFRCVFKIPPEDFESLQRYVDSPPEHNPGLENLFRQARSNPLAVKTREFSE